MAEKGIIGTVEEEEGEEEEGLYRISGGGATSTSRVPHLSRFDTTSSGGEKKTYRKCYFALFLSGKRVLVRIQSPPLLGSPFLIVCLLSLPRPF